MSKIEKRWIAGIGCFGKTYSSMFLQALWILGAQLMGEAEHSFFEPR
jgi:hypothetical protein